MIETWIDTLCAVWEVDDGKGRKVKSYRFFDKAEFPEAITVYPCAITYPTEMRNFVSATNCYDVWRGRTEFHLTGGVNKGDMPMIARYFNRIVTAAAGAVTLGGLVDYFLLDTDGPSQQGPVVLQYGSEAPHYGIIINWIVKEMTTLTATG